MNLKRAPVAGKKSQTLEPIHKNTDPRQGHTCPIGESLVANVLNCSLGLAILAEISKQEQNPSQSPLVGIEELVT